MHQKKRNNAPNRCHSNLKIKMHTTTEKQHFAHHLGQNSSQPGVHVTTYKYHWHTFYNRNRTNRNATYSVPIRVHSALFKDNASKLSGEMRRDKRANHRYKIDITVHWWDTASRTFTVNKPYDCHLLCFVEKCRCQAYQMKGQHSCELLQLMKTGLRPPDDFNRGKRLRVLWHEQRIWERQ